MTNLWMSGTSTPDKTWFISFEWLCSHDYSIISFLEEVSCIPLENNPKRDFSNFKTDIVEG